MNQYLKCYQVVMRTLGPVFVGSGNEIGKKEYVFLNQKKIGVLDIQGVYGELCRIGKGNAFEDYLLGNNGMDLTLWLRKQNIRIEDMKPFVKYTLDCGDAIIEKGANKLHVMECIKDAYGNPYIPGSSIKGMFRTILLGTDILNSPQKYQNAKQNLRKNMNITTSRTNYLKRDAGDIERIAYRTLQREKTKPNDAVNDVMQGMIISDSEPLSAASLVLCQKVDLHTKGTERRLPILRECIKPNAEICFTITIDTKLCPLTETAIMEAVQIFIDSYYKKFTASFAGMEKPKATDVLLGGGCGFVSKTVIYPLLGKKEGLDIVPKVFEKTNVPKVHKHYLDKEYGVSPHTMKCTKYQGKTYQMGLCRIEKISLI